MTINLSQANRLPAVSQLRLFVRVRSARHHIVCIFKLNLHYFWTACVPGFSSAVQYTSSYRPRKTIATTPDASIEIQYDRYHFTPTTFAADEDGNINEHISVEEKTIKISRDWRANVGDKPKDGYIAKGLMKYAFIVSRAPY